MYSIEKSRKEYDIHLRGNTTHDYGRELSQQLQTVCSYLLRITKRIFTKVPDQMFPNLVREFYSNLTFEYPSLKSTLKGIEINIHKYQFRRIFELSFCEVSYTYEGPIKN